MGSMLQPLLDFKEGILHIEADDDLVGVEGDAVVADEDGGGG